MSPLIVGSGSSGSEGRSDRFGLPTGTTDPGTSEAGDMYYNTDTSKIRVSDGTAWADLATGGGGGVTGYTIDNSLRFDSASSAHLSRAFSSSGNRRTWTWSGWIKRGKLDFGMVFASFADNSNRFYIAYYPSYILCFGRVGGVDSLEISTVPLYRDPSAWYHLVVSIDTTQATTDDRFKIYVNGVSQSLTVTTTPGLNVEPHLNSASTHRIAGYDGTSSFFDGYLADVNFIDGSALAPTAFGEFDATTGVWNPIEYTGTYPGNSFHLDFATNNVGNDASGNSNNWTANNLRTSSVIGPIYSSQLTASATGSPSGVQTPHYAFYYGSPSIADNSQTVGTRAYVNHNGGTSWIQFTPSSAISGTNLRIFTYQPQGTSGADTWININGGGDLRPWRTSANYTGWSNSVSIPGGSLTSIRVSLSYGGGSSIGIWAIEIDGTVLVETLGYELDYTVDSPTNGTASSGGDPGGSVVGNYCTWNPLSNGAGTLSNGNLQLGGIAAVTAGFGRANGTMSVSSGKWYFETTLIAAQSYTNVGIGQGNITNQYPGQDAVSYAFTCEQGVKINNNSQPAYGVSLTTGDVLMVAFDLDNLKIFFGKNGTWMASSDPVTGSNPAFTLAAGAYKPICRPYDENAVTATNFGQKQFSYQAPTGYKSLNTANLPTPTILNGKDYMDVVTWIGDGVSPRTFILNFSPDLIWTKNRSVIYWHNLYDAIRGTRLPIHSNVTNGNDTANDGLYGGVSAFNTNGFSVESGTSSSIWVNESTQSYVGWAWDAGDVAAVTNTDGTTQSTVKANVDAGFSIVQATISASNATLGHGLGVEPAMVIRKKVDGTSEWYTSVKVPGYEGYLLLNATNSFSSQGTGFTSTVFNAAYTGGTETWINYCFAPIDNYSAFGTYSGNSNADGSFVWTGFRVRWLLIKAIAGNDAPQSQLWYLIDSERDSYNLSGSKLFPNNANIENSGQTFANNAVDLLSNGFKCRAANDGTNTGNVYFYAAFAENPFSIARAR